MRAPRSDVYVARPGWQGDLLRIMAAREKGVGLKPSLCMILPLRNDADRVSLIFTQALEILPELTPRWNLVLFDDGSTDATGESLAELVRAYPQATVIHHSTA